MYEKLEVCPVCKSTNFQNHLICKDHSISGESFALTKCRKCGFVFTNPRPSESALPRYYQSANYISHTNNSNTLVNFIYKLVRNYTIKQKIRLIKRYTLGKHILDFGCGTGEFLQACLKKEYSVHGYEPNQEAQTQTQEKGITTYSQLADLRGKVDIITAWHVLEHVSDLKKTIKTLKKKLAKDGVMFIALPNLNSYDSIHYREFWAGLDVPRHLSHFTQESFGTLIAKHKLVLIDTVPMYFDSFYVAMLSEKYLHGKTKLFQALKIGNKSNKLAKRTGEYSSLIYILKK